MLLPAIKWPCQQLAFCIQRENVVDKIALRQICPACSYFRCQFSLQHLYHIYNFVTQRFVILAPIASLYNQLSNSRRKWCIKPCRKWERSQRTSVRIAPLPEEFELSSSEMWSRSDTSYPTMIICHEHGHGENFPFSLHLIRWLICLNIWSSRGGSL